MAILVPNTGSVFSTDSNVAGAASRWAWIGFTSCTGGSGCVMWQAGCAAGGSNLLPIVCACGAQTWSFGPLVSLAGLYAASVTGGCAWAQIKNACY